jgi:hypothetical protein
VKTICFFNNCNNSDHVGTYGRDAFFDLENSGRQATQASGLTPGQLCVVGSYGDGDQVIFRWYLFSKEAPRRYDGERRRVFFGGFLASETLPKRRAAHSVRYEVRGGAGFLDRGISGFLAGHNRRNEVHEEAQT